MQKSVKQLRVGNRHIRHVVIYTSPPCPEVGPESRHRQVELLSQLVQAPDLMNCGPEPFQKLRCYYSGAEWVAELEAVVDTGAETR